MTYPSIHYGDIYDDVMLLVSKYMQEIIMFDAPTMSKMMLQSKWNQGSEFIFEMQLMFLKTLVPLCKKGLGLGHIYGFFLYKMCLNW